MTRLESIKNNAYLLDLNMTRATKEQKIQWLCQIIDNETDKPEDEMDFALIGECSAYLRELSDKAAEATKEQKQRILQQIKAHHNQTATKSAKILRPSWRKMGRIVAIAAAVATILVSTLTVLAKVNGYSSAWEYVTENLQKIAGLNAGDRVNDGEITLIKNDGVIAYKSIEELLHNEGYNFLYPSELPDDVQIIKISQQYISEERLVYCYTFSDPSISITVSEVSGIFPEDLGKYEHFSTDNMVFYIKEFSNGSYQAVSYDDQYEYIFSINNYDKLLVILSGMKGLEK